MSCHVCDAAAIEPCQPWCSEHPLNYAAARVTKERLSTLAANLATAGQLCNHWNGVSRNAILWHAGRAVLWRPNTSGHPAPGFDEGKE